MRNLVYIKRIAIFLLAVLCLTALFCLPLSAEQENGRIYDPADLLEASDIASLTARLDELSRTSGVELYLATYVAENRYDDFIGDEYCRSIRNLKSEDAVLLIVTYDRWDGMYYYDMYTYGQANYAINQKEVNYILDSREVYNHIKSGYVAEGAEAFFEWSAKAYEGRVGASWGLIIVVSAIIALIIGFVARAGVVAAYKKKNASVDYPLDRYAKLELTRESDAFVREYTTRAYTPRSNGGGGGSRHGGGGGHRGGR
ncbi:MAG: TPM domain-containing protein [Clostridia bacterium]|nr:TPM domain-containing protein [Clostridia bacterium]